VLVVTLNRGTIEYCLSLKIAPPEKLIAGIVQKLSEQLAKALEDLDGEAFLFLYFQVLKVYCFDYHLSQYHFSQKQGVISKFNENAQKKAAELRNDQQFMAARDEILEDTEINKCFEEICQMSPEEFDQIDIQLLPTPIATVFKKLKGIAMEMLQGNSQFSGSLMRYCEQQQERKSAASNDEKS
ncbi:MAG TPA: hypothetical protein VGM34_02650, partial [Chlamydiales bacterium]